MKHIPDEIIKMIFKLNKKIFRSIEIILDDPYNIRRFIKNSSEFIQKLAVTQCGYVIRCIENPSEEIQRLAVTQHMGHHL